MWNCYGIRCVFSFMRYCLNAPEWFYPFTFLPAPPPLPHIHWHLMLSDFLTVWPNWWVWWQISYSCFNLQFSESWGIFPNVYCPDCFHPELLISICCPFSIGLHIISLLIYRGSLQMLRDYFNLGSLSFLICEWDINSTYIMELM